MGLLRFPPILQSATDDETTDPAPAGSPALLVADPGVTALSGRLLQASDGAPLKGVALRLGSHRTVSDGDGLFLLQGAPAGFGVLIIDGRQGQAQGAPAAVDHGVYEVRVKVEAGRTTMLPFVSWLPVIDHSSDASLPAVLDKDVTVTNAALPGVELRFPKADLRSPSHRPGR